MREWIAAGKILQFIPLLIKQSQVSELEVQEYICLYLI